MPLRIVHVSDIHFHKDPWNEDGDQRRELIDDLNVLVLTDGPVDAVLVGGDIAFSGQAEQYETARRWLDDLLEVCGGLDESRVYTVPGNHDVDVAVVKASRTAQDLRTVLRTCEPTAIDHELRQRIANDPAADGLFLPLANYNSFAARYLCTTSRKFPHWQDSTTFDVDGWPVSLTGQNSVLVSDLDDARVEDADGRHGLVLGTHQCRLSRQDDPVHIVMAHHPPVWIRDWKIVQHHMARAHLWLYGHEHAYKSEQITPMGSVQLAAGAVGPERDETGECEPWIPAYSIITLSRTERETLRIRVQPRYWSMERTIFIEHPKGVEEFEVSRRPAVPGPGSGAAPTHAPSLLDATLAFDEANTSAAIQPEPSAGLDSRGQEVRAGAASPLAEPLLAESNRDICPIGRTQMTSRPDLRRYATQFMSRPLSERIAIGQRLGVVEEEDLAAGSSPDTYRVVLRRINDLGLIPKLIDELENRP